ALRRILRPLRGGAAARASRGAGARGWHRAGESRPRDGTRPPSMRHALVTGASRGISRATAIALSERGDRLAVHYGTDAAAAEETLAHLHGTGHVLVGGD